LSARDSILERVRDAIAGASAGPIPRDYRRAVLSSDRVELFCERVSDYRADVRVISVGQEAEEIATVCVELGARRLVVPEGLPVHLRPVGVEFVEDADLTSHELAALDGVVTGCTVAIAETGTIVLTAAPDEGRRAITLVPDLHICIVQELRIVTLVPEAIARVKRAVGASRRPVTFISGPSATSDIELSRVEGVHGPRKLVVLVCLADLRTVPSASTDED